MQNIEFNMGDNDNVIAIREYAETQEGAQKKCWRMLGEVSQVVNLNLCDLIEVRGEDSGAHIALLARQFPLLGFEAGKVSNCGKAVRVLWIIGEDCLNEVSVASKQCDIIVVTHDADAVQDVQNVFPKFARIAAKRNIGDYCAISIFGKGLHRDIFKSKVRGEIAA